MANLMRGLFRLVAGSMAGGLLGGLGGLIAAQAVPICGEDCFAFSAGLIVGGAIVGVFSFPLTYTLARAMGWRRSAVFFLVFAVVTVAGARWATLHHYSRVHDPQESAGK